MSQHQPCATDTTVKWLGHLVAQLVKCPTSAQVMISRFVSSSPVSGSVLTARSLEPASDSVSPSLSAPPRLALSHSRINKYIKNKTNKNPSETIIHQFERTILLITGTKVKVRSFGNLLDHSKRKKKGVLGIRKTLVPTILKKNRNVL